MKILVFGVGAIGSLLIHFLCKAGNDVTVVARSTYDDLKNNGLVIEHVLQKKTTTDRPAVVKEADMSQHYDIVFSVMQGQQQFSMLDTLSAVNTRLIVMVGNNPECDRCESYIKEHSSTKRHVLFGFQNSAGHRENGKTFAGVLPTTELVLGGAHSAADSKAAARVKRAFAVKGYKVTEVDDMYAYYMYHIAEIMPYILMSYKAEYDLKRMTRSDIKRIIKATGECFNYLKTTGIKVMPPKEDGFYSGGIKGIGMYLLYRIMSRTVLGDLMVADHARNGIVENRYLDSEFEKFCSAHKGTPMPTWDGMRKYLPKQE
ncbi:MAG: hypothetical protein IJ740_10540 [Ruminococcus sp.]|nr:hypothetical protein [Ruminococcus sp.]